ncbi:MAG: helix-turn-helix domain-containing protein [Propionicimonas sp.]
MAKKSNRKPPAESEWISLREASHIYGVSTDTLRRRISTGELPAVKLGYKTIRVRREHLDNLFRPIPAADPYEYRYHW